MHLNAADANDHERERHVERRTKKHCFANTQTEVFTKGRKNNKITKMPSETKSEDKTVFFVFLALSLSDNCADNQILFRHRRHRLSPLQKKKVE